MNYTITESNILIGEITTYDYYDPINNCINILDTEKRYILFLNHEFFDLETGEKYYLLTTNSMGVIKGHIYSCRKYITETYKAESVTKEDIQNAYELYKTILQRKTSIINAKKNKKLVYFPKKRIY